jgi:glycosyltransferase involved in cell wall biosynthesis
MAENLEVLIPADIRFPLERANGVQIVKTAAALARGGARVSLLVRDTDPRPTPEILAQFGLDPDEKLRVHRFAVGHRRGSFVLPRASFLARAAAATLRAPRRAAIYTRDLQLADLLLRFGPLGPRTVVYEAHAVESLMYGERGRLYGTGAVPDPRKLRLLARREGRVWRRAAGFVSTTNGIRDSFVEAYGARAHVRVIPNGCDVPAARPEARSVHDGGLRVVYAGQLYPWKGVDVLVQAMREVPDARLVILGGIEGERDTVRIRDLVAASGLGPRIEMRGSVHHAQVASELATASVVAVPFLRSGMTERHTSPIKAFEAMAAGRPIVASDLPSSREFLRHEHNALLVPPGDPVALAAAIRRLLDCPELAERLGRTAFAEAPRFSWDARARAVRELLEELT